MARASDRVYEIVRSGIVDGRYEPGARLREEDLASDIGVSRTPVREALRRLDADGLVDFSPNRGAHVATWSADDIEEIFALRALLEGFGARLAAERAGPDAAADLRRVAEDMAAAAKLGDLDRVAELNQTFHHTILSAAGNMRLVETLARLIEVPLVQRTFRHYGPDDLQRSLEHHRELVLAIEANDGVWAESVMRSHVLAARNVLRRGTPPR